MRVYSKSQGKIIEIPDNGQVSSPTVTPVTSAPNPNPIIPTNLAQAESNWLIGPAVKYGGGVLEAARKLALLTNPEYRQAVTGGAATMGKEARARVMALDKPIFTSERQQKYVREHPVEATAKNIAGAASYVIPAGKTLKGALALGGVMGGLRAYSEEKATPGQVVGGIAGGAVAGGLFYGAGKAWQKGKELLRRGGEKVGERSAADLLKATPTAYKNAGEAGYDLRKLVKKYGVVGNLDEMVGPIENPNSGWFQQALNETESGLQSHMKQIGKQKVDLSPVINQLNYKRSQLLMAAVPDEEAISALDDVINIFTARFKGRDIAGKFMGGNNVSADRALEIVRNANQEFGKSIVQSTKGTVTDQGNKIIAQTLRHTLKNQFHQLGENLTREHELILLRDVLQDAQYKGVTGLGLGRFDITRPLTTIEPLAKSPQVSSRLAQMQAVPPTPAGLQRGAADLNAPLLGTMRDVTNPVEWASINAEVMAPKWKVGGPVTIGELDEFLKKGNQIKAEELGYMIKNRMNTDLDFAPEGHKMIMKIVDRFPGLKKAFGGATEAITRTPGIGSNLTSTAVEAAEGWAPGMKAVFDRALLEKNIPAVNQMLNSGAVPKSYQAQFANEIGQLVQSPFKQLVNLGKFDQAGSYAQSLPDTNLFKKPMLSILDSQARFANQAVPPTPAGLQPGFIKLPSTQPKGVGGDIFTQADFAKYPKDVQNLLMDQSFGGNITKSEVVNFLHSLGLSGLSNKSGLKPGSIDLGYISDVLQSGPNVVPPTPSGLVGMVGKQAAAVTGANLASTVPSIPGTSPAGGGVPVSPALPTPAPQGATDESRMRLAYLMYQYPKYASQLKSMYEMINPGETGGANITKVSAQNYSNSLSGAASLKEVNRLIFNPDGKLDSGTIVALRTPGTPSQKARQLKAQLYNVADSYLRLRTGAQANPDEIRRLANSLEPGLLDNVDTINTKLNIYNTVFNYYLQLAQGGQVVDQTVPPTYQVPATPQELYAQ